MATNCRCNTALWYFGVTSFGPLFITQYSEGEIAYGVNMPSHYLCYKFWSLSGFGIFKLTS